MIERTLHLIRSPRTYLRVLYLFLAFPLGVIYLCVLISGVSVGVGTAVIVIGLPILVLTMFAWLWFARLERELAIHLLGATVRPMSVPDRTPRNAWQLVSKHLGDPVTWKSLAYVLLEFPFGIISFVLVIVLLAVSLSMVLAPVTWLTDAPATVHFGTHVLRRVPGVGGFAESLTTAIVGVLVTVGSLWLLNGLGSAWGRFAEVMLGVDESRLQLAAAQAEAETQRGRAEASEQKRRELLVNASHELRTPVASISAHVESLLKPDRPLDEESRQYLGVVAAETERLGSLVEDVLSLARADADELHLKIAPVDVTEVIDRITETLAPLARRERNLSLVHSSEPGLPRAMADRDRLTQVLTNLVRNALNYTPDGGIVSVQARAAVADLIVIEVSDTGIGIEPQDLEHIFDRFYRTDQSRARDSGGAGLGLAIVRDLVTAMGGTIVAESTPGQGSAFRIELKREAA